MVSDFDEILWPSIECAARRLSLWSSLLDMTLHTARDVNSHFRLHFVEVLNPLQSITG
jgi:hypothetical protein